MSILNSPDLSNVDDQPVFAAFNGFLKKLKNEEWLSVKSKDEIRCCMHSANTVEKLLTTFETNGSLGRFLSLVPNLYGFEKDELQKMCDVVLTMVLSAPGVPLSCVKICIHEYTTLCGRERFEEVLTSVLFCSEVYRVVLDYLASSDVDLEKTGVKFQSQLFSCLWKHESDIPKLINCFYDWLHGDANEQNIAVALMVISCEDESSQITLSLVHVLCKVLLERGNLAMLFWNIDMKLPYVRQALEKSGELRKGVFGFLKTASQWMEATPSFTWSSVEKGPCKAFGFKELVSAIQCLQEMKGDTLRDVKEFLVQRRKSPGCTLWDDVEMQLNCS